VEEEASIEIPSCTATTTSDDGDPGKTDLDEQSKTGGEEQVEPAPFDKRAFSETAVRLELERC